MKYNEVETSSTDMTLLGVGKVHQPVEAPCIDWCWLALLTGRWTKLTAISLEVRESMKKHDAAVK